jgi:hypothetical protein
MVLIEHEALAPFITFGDASNPPVSPERELDLTYQIDHGRLEEQP